MGRSGVGGGSSRGDDVGQSPEVEGLEKKYEKKETGGN